MCERAKHPHPGSGKASHQGVSIVEVVRRVPANKTAADWIASVRWPDGAVFPNCRSGNVRRGAKHPNMSYRCRRCRKLFSIRTGTVMQNSNLDAQSWVIATYMLTKNLKVDFRMQRHSDLDNTQKSTWDLLGDASWHRAGEHRGTDQRSGRQAARHRQVSGRHVAQAIPRGWHSVST